jgi:hypothetical protein
MKAFNWRKWCHVIHRDLGYLFFGATVVYASSGLAINHRNDWNPSYSISRRELVVPAPGREQAFTRRDATNLLAQAGADGAYQKHYSPSNGVVKVFYEGGSVVLERDSGRVVVETLRRRPLLHTFNRLHYNPGRWWTWFADAYSVALVLLAVSGLFLLRGYHGITRRGGVLALIGIAVPTILVLCYL